MDNSIKKSKYYRPEWTVGRYNKENRVAIMYNLIEGYSHFFEEYSADVIEYILKTKRNSEVDIDKITTDTRISHESIYSFFEILCSVGLLIIEIPSKEGIDNYRKICVEKKKNNCHHTKSTKDKLPMDISTAERSYFEAVEKNTLVSSVMFELTYNCSEKCIHCYNPGATRNDNEISYRNQREELELNDYKRIIDELYENGLVRVTLTGGDPFSKPITWDIIEYLYQKEIVFDIFTNGQSILNKIDKLASYYPHIVGISIYSGIPEVHDTITRIKGSWEKSMSVIKQLSDLSVPMNIKCCVMQPNLHSYYMVTNLAKKYGTEPQFEINITDSNEGDRCARQLRLTENQLEVVLRDNNIKLYIGEEAPNFGGQAKDMNTNGCGAGHFSFCITPEGNLQPCCSFPMILGNLKRQSFQNILEKNEYLEKWRQATLNEYTECGKNEYCAYCNLCPGQGYIEHGSYLKPAESCCYMAKIRYNLAQKMKNGYNPLNGKEFVEALQELPINNVELRRIFDTKG